MQSGQVWNFDSRVIRISGRLHVAHEKRSNVMNNFKGFALRNWQSRVAYLELEKTGIEQVREEKYLVFCFEHISIEVSIRHLHGNINRQ